MKSTLFATTLAAALTGTSFGQVEVQLMGGCCGWNYTYQNEVLTFVTSEPFGYTDWDIQVPEDTVVQFTCFKLEAFPFVDVLSDSPLTAIAETWAAQGQPSFWTGTVVLPAGNYSALFGEFQGTINFNYETEPQGSCCVNSGCASIAEAECSEMGGTWTEGGSCDDCEPVADDCPADVDGDGIPDACDADQITQSNGHWYAGIVGQTTWTDARLAAEKLGGHLATLTTVEENNFVYENVASEPSLWNFYSEQTGGHGPAIGGIREDPSDPASNFTWVTGEPWSWTNWSPGSPSSVDSQGNVESYLHFYSEYVPPQEYPVANEWNDIRNNPSLVPMSGFIVEWPSQESQPHPLAIRWGTTPGEDCNQNGIIDSCEIVPDDCGNEPCPADVDGDGSIGFSDVLIILNDWGACP